MTDHEHAPHGEARYCIQCGSPLESKHRAGRTRPTCPNCGWIFFEDPKVAAGVLVIENEEVLLVRRAFDPERGKWALPAGFVDARENPRLAAVRECQEETGLAVEVGELAQVFYGREHDIGADITFVYHARVRGGELGARDDADAARFFARDRLPPLAFTSTQRTLADWVGDA